MSNYQLESLLEGMEAPAPDEHVLVEEKIAVTSVATAVISLEIVVVVDVAGNFPTPLCLFQERSKLRGNNRLLRQQENHEAHFETLRER